MLLAQVKALSCRMVVAVVLSAGIHAVVEEAIASVIFLSKIVKKVNFHGVSTDMMVSTSGSVLASPIVE